MKQSVFIACLSGLLICLCSLRTQALELVENGNARCTINAGKETRPIEKHCISELQKYVKRISGAHLSVETGDSSRQILLGTTSSNH